MHKCNLHIHILMDIWMIIQVSKGAHEQRLRPTAVSPMCLKLLFLEMQRRPARRLRRHGANPDLTESTRSSPKTMQTSLFLKEKLGSSNRRRPASHLDFGVNSHKHDSYRGKSGVCHGDVFGVVADTSADDVATRAQSTKHNV